MLKVCFTSLLNQYRLLNNGAIKNFCFGLLKNQIEIFQEKLYNSKKEAIL